MFQLKAILFISAVVLCCGTFTEAKRWSVLDRFRSNYGYYVPSVDKTAFTVSEKISLRQIDLPKVFGYHHMKKLNLESVPATVTVIEVLHGEQEILFSDETTLSSQHEAIVKVPWEIELEPNTQYEIHVETPQDQHIMINEHYELGVQKLRRFFKKSIEVNFHQGNALVPPPTEKETKRKLSQGLVRRMHFVY